MTDRYTVYHYIHNLDEDLYDMLHLMPTQYGMGIITYRPADLPYYTQICTDLARALDMRDLP